MIEDTIFTTKRVEVFLSLVETLSFSNTALDLGMTQPAITNQIKEFEKELGLDLFTREHNGTQITEIGTTIATYLQAQRRHNIGFVKNLNALNGQQKDEYDAIDLCTEKARSYALRQVVAELSHDDMFKIAKEKGYKFRYSGAVVQGDV